MFVVTWLALLCFVSACTAQLQLYGVNYGPRRTVADCATLENIQQDVPLMLKITRRIKTFHLRDTSGDCPHAEHLLRVLSQMPPTERTGVELFLGLWLNQTQAQFDRERNELQRLMQMFPQMFQDHVQTVIVGSETIFRGDLQPNKLRDYITEVQQLRAQTETTKHIKVTTSEVGGSFYADELLAQVDLVMPNLYPFWQVTILYSTHTIHFIKSRFFCECDLRASRLQRRFSSNMAYMPTCASGPVGSL
jgi:exo-beta-1,3-glucanase (GH17 family)